MTGERILTAKIHLFPPDFGKIAAALALCGAVFAAALAHWCIEPTYEASVILAIKCASGNLSGGTPRTPDAASDLAAYLDRGAFLLPGIAEGFENPRFAARFLAPEAAAADTRRIQPGRQTGTIVVTGAGNSPASARRRVRKAVCALQEIGIRPSCRGLLRAVVQQDSVRRTAPNRLVWTAAGLLAGLAAAYLTGCGLRYLDASRPTGREMEKILRIPLLGTVPSPDPGQLLNRFRFLLPHRDGARVILFTGVSRNAGKGQAVARLAQLLAADGKRVLIVAADGGRRHFRSAPFRAAPQSENPFAADRIVVSGDPSVPDFLPCFQTASETSPEAAARAGALEELLLTAAGRYDLILIDAPPAPGSAAPVLFGHLADAVILIAEGRRREVKQLRDVLSRLYSAVLIPAGMILTGRNADDAEQLSSYRYGGAKQQKAIPGA